MKPDWKEAPEWARWLAMDDDGEWYWFEVEPELRDRVWARVSGDCRQAGWSDRPLKFERPQTTTPQPEGQGDEGKHDA